MLAAMGRKQCFQTAAVSGRLLWLHVERTVQVWLCLQLLLASGCHRLPSAALGGLDKGIEMLIPPPPIEISVSNPAHVDPVDPDFLWRQIVDAVDDFFRIDSEQPVRRDSINWLEGRLTTYPEVSGTCFEPWRRDAARGFERLQSTIQSIRRTATLRVVPEASGYIIEVQVMKEQEDVDQSQFATAGAATQRHDGSIVRNENQLRQQPITLGWYQIGRDRDLERRIMERILGRITNVAPPRPSLLRHDNP